jgi:hypothetical protein
LKTQELRKSFFFSGRGGAGERGRGAGVGVDAADAAAEAEAEEGAAVQLLLGVSSTVKFPRPPLVITVLLNGRAFWRPPLMVEGVNVVLVLVLVLQDDKKR